MKILLVAIFALISACDPVMAQEPERDTREVIDVFFYYNNGYWPEDIERSTKPPTEEADRYIYRDNSWTKEEWSVSCPADDNGNDYIECPQSYGVTDGIDRGIYDVEP